MNDYSHSSHFRPGQIEAFYGPMYSGKTEAMMERIKRIDRYIRDGSEEIHTIFKPTTDDRDERPMIGNRDGGNCYAGIWINSEKPIEIFDYLEDHHRVVCIDEAQFFNEHLTHVVWRLAKQGFNVLVGGLPLDFRGMPFGPMPNIVAMANTPHKLSAVCDVQGCFTDGEYTQRHVGTFVKGDWVWCPAPWDDPVVYVEKEGVDENGLRRKYGVRCQKHHKVTNVPDLEGIITPR